MIIVIDGPAGTGKSTVAKAVAKRLGFSFFDTGAMYRSVAWKVVQDKIDPSDEKAVTDLMTCFSFEIQTGKNQDRAYFVNGVNVTQAIREPYISPIASQIATYQEVRSSLVRIQRKFGYRCDAVFEGRDIGTVVFPDADLKIFLTADPQVRAERRYQELLTKFPDLAESLSFNQILEEIKKRDEIDATRAISPLRCAKDAVLIDTTHLTVEQVIKQVLKLKKALRVVTPKMKLSYKIVYSLVRFFFKVCFRLKIYGVEHVKQGAGVLVSNHASFYDPPVLSISCPEEVHFLAKESLFHIPLLGSLIKVLNTHPLSRKATDISTFRLMIDLLQSGKKVILFPEGRRTMDGELQPLERGLPFLVIKSKTTIYPAYISGTFKAWPRGRRIPKFFGNIQVVFGSLIHFSEFDGLDKRAAEDAVLQRTDEAIRSLKAWLENGAVGIPP